METCLGDANHRDRAVQSGMKICSQPRPMVGTEPDIDINDDKVRPSVQFRDEGQEAGQFSLEEVSWSIRCYLSDLMRHNLVGSFAMPIPEQGTRRSGLAVCAIVDVSCEDHDIQRIFRASAHALNRDSASGWRQSNPKFSRAGKRLSLKKASGTA